MTDEWSYKKCIVTILFVAVEAALALIALHELLFLSGLGPA